MKKTIIVFNLLLGIAILISSCGATGQVDSVDVGNPTTGITGEEFPLDATLVPDREDLPVRLSEGEMPLATRLGLGTIRLDETDYSVSPEQAAALLPLWKALRSLSESETTASEEIEAIQKQIQDTLTSEQITLIEDMQFTNEEMREIFGELGLGNGNGTGGFENLTPEMQATMQAARESGQFQGMGSGGGIPGTGMGPGGGLPGGGELSPEARETAIAERGAGRGALLGVNRGLLEAVITFLEGKMGG